MSRIRTVSMRCLIQIVTLLLVPLALPASTAVSSSPPPEVVHLEGDQYPFFAAFSPTNARFLGLLREARYAQIAREHMFVEVSDTGTWSQDSSGVVRLRSDTHFRDVEYGPLRVFLWYAGKGMYLKKVQCQVRQFLKSTSANAFSPAEVRSIYQYPSPVVKEMILEAIEVDFRLEMEGRPVSRSDLEQLLAKLHAYEVASDISEFRFIPLRYKGEILLEWENHDTPMNRDRAKMVKVIDSPKSHRELLGSFFVRIQEDTFRVEVTKAQPFIFYPHMSKGTVARDTVDDLLKPCGNR